MTKEGKGVEGKGYRNMLLRPRRRDYVVFYFDLGFYESSGTN